MKTPEDLKRETATLVRAERDERLDRKAKAKRNGMVLDAYDRLSTPITPNAVESMPRTEMEQACGELERFRQDRSRILAEVARLNAWADELGKRAETAESDRDAARWSADIKEKAALAALAQRDARPAISEDDRSDLRWVRGFVCTHAEPGTKRLEVVLELLERLSTEPSP